MTIYHLRISGIHSKQCANDIEKKLTTITGIESVEVNLNEHRAKVVASTDISIVLQQLAELGYDGKLIETDQTHPLLPRQLRFIYQQLIYKTLVAWLLTIPLLVINVFHFVILRHSRLYLIYWLTMASANLVIIILTLPQLKKTWRNLSHIRLTVADIFMLTALFCFVYSGILLGFSLALPLLFASSSAILACYHTLELLTFKLRYHCELITFQLQQYLNTTARKINQAGEEVISQQDTVSVGDMIRVKADETICADGTIILGESYINEAAVNGQFTSRKKHAGEPLYAGSINQSASLLYKVTHTGSNTRLGQIIDYFHHHYKACSPLPYRLTWLTLGLFSLSMIALVLPIGLGMTVNQFINLFLAMMMMANPLLISDHYRRIQQISLAKALALGLLIKPQLLLKYCAKISVLIVNKTGIITRGKPTVVALHCLDLQASSKRQLLTMAASLEQGCDHPIAHAILQAAKIEKLTLAEISHQQMIPGKGVSAYCQQSQWHIGSAQFMQDKGIALEQLSESANYCAAQGQSPIFLGKDNHIIGMLSLSDPIKRNITDIIQQFNENNIQVIMLSDDHAKTTQAIAEEVGINQYYSGLTEQEKINLITSFQAQGESVAMFDTVDSVALKQANLAITALTNNEITPSDNQCMVLNTSFQTISDGIHLALRMVNYTRRMMVLTSIYQFLSILLIIGLSLNTHLLLIASVIVSLFILVNAYCQRHLMLTKPCHPSLIAA